MRKRLQAGFLTCILPSGSFPFAQGGQWTTPHGFPKRVSSWKWKVSRALHTSELCTSNSLLEQMLTAARPSRILTAFPFRYPKARGLETCSRTMHLAKNSLADPTPRRSRCQEEIRFPFVRRRDGSFACCHGFGRRVRGSGARRRPVRSARQWLGSSTPSRRAEKNVFTFRPFWCFISHRTDEDL